MQTIRDRYLKEPFARWADRNTPLPDNVVLIPRTIDLPLDAGMFLILGIMFGGMGLLFLLLPPWSFNPAADGWPLYIFLAAVVSALWSVPLMLLRRALITIRAWNDLRHQRLRLGLFFGAEGMLVRLEPARCNVISWDRFVVARLFPPARSRDYHSPVIIIETRDGSVRFFAHRLVAGPEDIHGLVKKYFRSWSEPESLMRIDRVKRKEPQVQKKFLKAALIFGGAMLAIGGSLAANIARPNNSAAALALLISLVLLGAAIFNVFFTMFAIKFRHRCAECGKRIERNYEALPAVHYYCPSCNVEWETSLEERVSDKFEY